MQAIKSSNTSIEIKLRNALWSNGYRYRKNYTKLIGKPDIVFIKKKIAIFCDSEFWHGYDWENRKNSIKSNSEYWIGKIERNIERDKHINHQLRAQGWIVLRFWGKEIEKNIDYCLDTIEKALGCR
jgi:DNA mismatch endonuclease (patch repair protein)